MTDPGSPSLQDIEQARAEYIDAARTYGFGDERTNAARNRHNQLVRRRLEAADERGKP